MVEPDEDAEGERRILTRPLSPLENTYTIFDDQRPSHGFSAFRCSTHIGRFIYDENNNSTNRGRERPSLTFQLFDQGWLDIDRNTVRSFDNDGFTIGRFETGYF